MKNIFLRIVLFTLVTITFFQCKNKVEIIEKINGFEFLIDGEPTIINGINWDYVPIGNNVLDTKFWQKSDEIIKAGLDEEMYFWQNMGVNAIRTYVGGIPPKWVTYIYENFGIYTMMNHQFGAYGVNVNGVWNPKTDYSNPVVQKHLIDSSLEMVKTYKDTPGLLLFMLGNENNYHLTWDGAETDAGVIINDDDKIKRAQARAMYKLFNDATLAIKKIDASHPIGICNGDLLYLDLITEECSDIDVFGTNMYRGVSFYDAFDKVKKTFNKPILFTEFGSDAFNAKDNKEDQFMQAYYVINNWKEIYSNVKGLGRAQNSIGGFTFQSSDGWFKAGFDKRINAKIHDTISSWSSNGYDLDQQNKGDKNMNEEWFGIAAKGQTDNNGLYKLYPRAVYYALKKVHNINPYQKSMDSIQYYFKNIDLKEAVKRAKRE